MACIASMQCIDKTQRKKSRACDVRMTKTVIHMNKDFSTCVLQKQLKGFLPYVIMLMKWRLAVQLWDDFVDLCWVVGQCCSSEPAVCIRDCLSALQGGDAWCSQTDLHALVLMLSWAVESVCSGSVGGWGTWEL